MNTIKEDYKKILSFYKAKKVLALVLSAVFLFLFIFLWQILLPVGIVSYLIRIWVKSKKNDNGPKICPNCKEEVKQGAKVCPHCQRKISHWNILKVFVVIVFGFIILSIIVASNSDTTQKQEKKEVKENINTNVPVVEEKEQFVFDIPALLGKNVDEIIKVLGTPTINTEPTKLQISAGVDTWEKTWNKGSYSLMATYNTKDRTLVDLFLSTGNNFTNADEILKKNNLSKNNSSYSVSLVESRNKNMPGYTGIIIKLK